MSNLTTSFCSQPQGRGTGDKRSRLGTGFSATLSSHTPLDGFVYLSLMLDSCTPNLLLHLSPGTQGHGGGCWSDFK